MFYFRIEAIPTANNKVSGEIGGAFVNCWIDFKMQEGAEAVARHYILAEGWMPDTTEEARWVEEAEYQDMPESLGWFMEAEKDGACFVYHTWPVDGEPAISDSAE